MQRVPILNFDQNTKIKILSIILHIKEKTSLFDLNFTPFYDILERSDSYANLQANLGSLDHNVLRSITKKLEELNEKLPRGSELAPVIHALITVCNTAIELKPRLDHSSNYIASFFKTIHEIIKGIINTISSLNIFKRKKNNLANHQSPLTAPTFALIPEQLTTYLTTRTQPSDNVHIHQIKQQLNFKRFFGEIPSIRLPQQTLNNETRIALAAELNNKTWRDLSLALTNSNNLAQYFTSIPNHKLNELRTALVPIINNTRDLKLRDAALTLRDLSYEINYLIPALRANKPRNQYDAL